MSQTHPGRVPRGWQYHPLEIIVRPGAVGSTLARELAGLLSKTHCVGFVRHGADVALPDLSSRGEFEIEVNGQRSRFLREGHLDLPLQRALLLDADLVVVEGRIESCGPSVFELEREAPRNLSLLGIRPDDILCGPRRPVDGIPSGGVPWFEPEELPEIVEHLLEHLERSLRARPLWGLALLAEPASHPDSAACLQILSSSCERVLVASPDPIASFEPAPDSHPNLSDLGRILSCLEAFPEKAFLVANSGASGRLEATVGRLLESRDPFRVATALRETDTHLPERFPSLWEPKSRQRILYALAADLRCPQRILTHSRIQLLEPIGQS